MRFRDLRLGAKQLLAFGLILLLMTAVNIYSITRVQSLKTDLDSVTRNWLPRITAISRVNESTSNLRIQQLLYATAADSTAKANAALEMLRLIDQINENLDRYTALREHSDSLGISSAEEVAWFELFDDKWEDYQDLSIAFIALSRGGRMTEATELLGGDAIPAFDKFSEALVELVRINREQSLAAAEQADRATADYRAHTLGALLATLAFTLFVAWLLTRLIVRPVRRLSTAAREVAEGNLQVRVGDTGSDEIGYLSRAFDDMTAALALARERTEQQRAEIERKNADLERTLAELRTTQEQLVLSEKMASLGDLVAGVAHELNNPAGAAISAGDVAQRCVGRIENLTADPSEAAQGRLSTLYDNLRENITLMVTANRRIADIVGSLKNFARLDEADRQYADLHQGLDSSVTLLGSEVQNRIAIEKDYGDIPRVLCNPARLNQVFLNVLKNAAAAIPETGTIRIATRTAGTDVTITITDTGRGIPDDQLARIFEFRFASGHKRIKLGSGLSTAYNIMREHGGNITLESTVGRGTSVTLTLPPRSI